MSRTITVPLLSLCLASCASLSNAGKSSVAMLQKTASATGSKVSSLSDLISPSGVKVVEVREKDLKELPTGQERALAFENRRKRGFWIFGGPVDFVEPTLPAPGAEMDGSLLPPKMP